MHESFNLLIVVTKVPRHTQSAEVTTYATPYMTALTACSAVLYVCKSISQNITKLKCVLSWFLARDVIYTSRAFATMSVSVCLSVTEVH